MKKKTKKAMKPSLDALTAEAVRASVLDESGRDKAEAKSEGDALLDAVWTLYNPCGIEGRAEKFETVVRTESKKERGMPPVPPRKKFFTAHAHPDEPLDVSPEDILEYHALDLEHGAGIHYLVDGFKIKKIE
ncbi:MAG: hypothetical protein II889_13735 [Clostridia bacterium]|nr:hypothetical protein [Clostridia bacterium]MCR4904552.1 hypothetical protein [Clostridiales bacterium]